MLMTAFIKALIAVPVFLLLAWWNAAVAMLFGIAALTWVLAPVYFGSQEIDLSAGESQRDREHRQFFE